MTRPPSVQATARERCLLCGGERFTDLFIPRRDLTMSRCVECGLWVNQNTDLLEDLGEHYGTEYHEAHFRRTARRKARSAACIVRDLEALHPRTGRLVDIGCSFGFVVQAAKDRGWDACGVEPSAAMVADGRARGLKMEQGDLRHLPFPDAHFDVIHARHVLEHDIEVYESLAEIRRVLADDGLLAVIVPDGGCAKVRRRGASYFSFWHPDHMLAFTRPSLAMLMQRTGFGPVSLGLCAGLGGDGCAGVARLLGWRLASRIPEKLGLGNTITSFWRKLEAPGLPD